MDRVELQTKTAPAVFQQSVDLPPSTGWLGRYQRHDWLGVKSRIWPVLGCAAVVVIVSLVPGIPSPSRAIFTLYGLALVAWATNIAPAGWVGAAIVMVGSVWPIELGASVSSVLSSSIVWLIFGAFILSETIHQSGLAQRCLDRILVWNPTPQRLSWRITGLLMLLAFCVPSTSARSALMLPLVRGSMVSAAPGFLRYLNLLIPCVVLMSTPITLYGAAAHLLANAMLAESGSEPFTFTGWLLVAAPFAISSTLITAWLVLRLHLPPDAAISLTKPANATTTWSRSEILTLIVLVGLFLAVFTSHWHGWAFSTSLMLAALLLVMPGLGVLDWGDTLRRAPWDLLFFAGSAVWLTQALVQSGTGAWLVDQFLDPVSLSRLPPVLVVLMLGVVTITAHLYLPSHTARVAVLLPPLLVLSQQLGWNPALITLLAVLGIDYCLTFPVSSKAILLFDLDQQQTAKLVRLSLLLMPLYCLLMVIFYMLWWHPLGLTL